MTTLTELIETKHWGLLIPPDAGIVQVELAEVEQFSGEVKYVVRFHDIHKTPGIVDKFDDLVAAWKYADAQADRLGAEFVAERELNMRAMAEVLS